MNGRIYDSRLGRFLQADPFIQAATNTQSYNRYSYVMNNPLNATDPSGFFLKGLWNSIRPYVGVIVAVVVAIICYGTCTVGAYMLGGAIAGGSQAAANGGNIIAGAFWGAFSGLAGNVGGWQGFLASGVVGGASSVAMGGKFGNGFISAGISGVVPNTGYFLADLVVKALVGGTVSEMTGGKFANGAQSSAIAFLLTSGIQKIAAGGAFAAKPANGKDFEQQKLTDHDQIIDGKIKLILKAGVPEDFAAALQCTNLDDLESDEAFKPLIEKFNKDGDSITFKGRHLDGGSLMETPSEDFIWVNTYQPKGMSQGDWLSATGHEFIHATQWSQHRMLEQDKPHWQSEMEAYKWQINHQDQFGVQNIFKSSGLNSRYNSVNSCYMNGVSRYAGC